MTQPNILLYGAYGYTGKLIAKQLQHDARQSRVVLAGRRSEPLSALGRELDLDTRVLSLDNTNRLAETLHDIDVVIHAAGPFIHTAPPMIDACLATKTHYLDITGEIPVFEHAYARDAKARDAGITLFPGAGFDVVPSDCLLNYVAQQLNDPVELVLAIDAIGTPSAGTAKTMVEHFQHGSYVRRDGELVAVPFGYDIRSITFPHRRSQVVAIPWGDLASAFRSTGVPNITTLMAQPLSVVRWGPKVIPWARHLLKWAPLRRSIQRRIERRITGPDETARKQGRSFLWAQATDVGGKQHEARLETPEGYRLTAMTATDIAHRLAQGCPPGATTPAACFGTDYILEFDEVERRDGAR